MISILSKTMYLSQISEYPAFSALNGLFPVIIIIYSNNSNNVLLHLTL